MGAHGHVMLLRESDGLTHHAGVAAMKPTSDVGGGDERHDGSIGADVVGSEAFAHVAIQVDGRHSATLTSGLRFRFSTARFPLHGASTDAALRRGRFP